MRHRTIVLCAGLGLVAMIGISLTGIVSDAKSKAVPAADAQSPSAAGAESRDPCRAEVTATDLNVAQCPLASLHFHGRVSDCRDSRGTFVYRYLWVDPERKDELRRTASWAAHTPEWDTVEQVPTSCDREIDDVQVERVTSCTCSKP